MNPYEPTSASIAKPGLIETAWLYWNAILAGVAFSLHCLPFAAYDFIDDKGATGRMLFPLAPLALIIAMGCVATLLVQFVLMLNSLGNRSAGRYHRMIAMLLTCVAIALIFVVGRFGWFIHV
ncbi:MAG: hypothetical protein ABI557_19365 [Aureliella sp.]